MNYQDKKQLFKIVLFTFLVILFAFGTVKYISFIVELELNEFLEKLIIIIPIPLIAILLFLLQNKILDIEITKKEKYTLSVILGTLIVVILLIVGLILDLYKILNFGIAMLIVIHIGCAIGIIYVLFEWRKKGISKESLFFLTYLFPGLGQMVLGKWKRGILILLSFIILLSITIFLVSYPAYKAMFTFEYHSQNLYRMLFLTLFITVIFALWSIKDAYNLFKLKNQK